MRHGPPPHWYQPGRQAKYLANAKHRLQDRRSTGCSDLPIRPLDGFWQSTHLAQQLGYQWCSCTACRVAASVRTRGESSSTDKAYALSSTTGRAMAIPPGIRADPLRPLPRTSGQSPITSDCRGSLSLADLVAVHTLSQSRPSCSRRGEPVRDRDLGALISHIGARIQADLALRDNAGLSHAPLWTIEGTDREAPQTGPHRQPGDAATADPSCMAVR